MLEHHVLPLRHVHQPQLGRHPAPVIRGEPHPPALGPGDPPAAQTAFRVVPVGHDLAAPAVGLAPAAVVQLSLDAVQQAADGVVVLPRDLGLSLPEVPVSVALPVLQIQEFVGRDGDKVDLHPLAGADHAYLLRTEKVPVNGAQLGTQHHGPGVAPVLPRGHAIGSPEGPGERLLGGKAIRQRNVQQAFLAVPHLLQGKGQPPAPQIIPKPHARDLPELSGGIRF